MGLLGVLVCSSDGIVHTGSFLGPFNFIHVPATGQDPMALLQQLVYPNPVLIGPYGAVDGATANLLPAVLVIFCMVHND